MFNVSRLAMIGGYERVPQVGFHLGSYREHSRWQAANRIDERRICFAKHAALTDDLPFGREKRDHARMIVTAIR